MSPPTCKYFYKLKWNSNMVIIIVPNTHGFLKVFFWNCDQQFREEKETRATTTCPKHMEWRTARPSTNVLQGHDHEVGVWLSRFPNRTHIVFQSLKARPQQTGFSVQNPPVQAVDELCSLIRIHLMFLSMYIPEPWMVSHTHCQQYWPISYNRRGEQCLGPVGWLVLTTGKAIKNWYNRKKHKFLGPVAREENKPCTKSCFQDPNQLSEKWRQ